MSFDLLSPELVSVLAEKGITSPTPPQEDAIPRIMKGENILVVAPTGIGKTEAAMLPVLDMIFRRKDGVKGFKCIYITPLRALNRDMLRRMEDYGRALGIRVGVRHGDTTQYERARQSEDPPEVLITTPETLQVLFTGKRLAKHLAAVRWVIIDEIHELADTERGAQLSVAMERLSAVAGNYQRIGLSATVGDAQATAMFLGGRGRRVSIRKHDTYREFEINVESPTPDEADTKLRDKLQGDPEIIAVMKRARQIMESGRSTLFFVNTRETAEWLAARYHVWDESLSVDVHHGSLSKETRMEMEDRFKRGELKTLICTSSLELGIDVGSTDMVVQYNSPRKVSRMIQRAGRAGHKVGEKIRAKIIATAPDEVAEALVIARRCSSKELEDRAGRPSPLTVVANQLIAMTMSGPIDKDTAFKMFYGAYPFRTLARSDMEDVLEQLKSIRMVFDDGEKFKRSKKGMNYFYNNISMIPDERNYRVRDIGTRAIIGTLDESFVATFQDAQAMFIAKGRTWRVVEMREDEILVEEVRDMGEVPSWVGSDIPVPFEVAQEVGKMRRIRNYEDYPGDDGCTIVLNRFLDEQEARHKMPTDKVVTVDMGDCLTIVNACFGTRVNETLGKIYGALLSARLGESIGVTADPYRIMLELPRFVDWNTVKETIVSVQPGTVEALARKVILNSTFLKWRFAFVAKKFGIIEKAADHRFINFGKLFEIHQGTPAYREAIDKVLWEDLDIPNTEKVVSMIASGEIEVVMQTMSHIGLEGITRSKELMQPMRADHAILMALKKRLEDEVMFATCMNCGNQRRFRVVDAPKRFECDRCGGCMIAVLKEYDRELGALVKKKDLTKDEIKARLKMNRCANLINEYGGRAAMVLAARGVGPDTASRILRSMYVDEDGFLRSILTAEVTYAKNKQFWD
ncbi:MAG: DEAD/DEAH box helicase [Candidatus Methanomethylophilaceae archaeon]|nr:DEAD/DEAH box helicase [Candidatus Methanomethylophilaceae archaeon]